tara:strand:+ start:88 stop:336 length:249 start_codon:yes stop_codon:yes gene_type:complete
MQNLQLTKKEKEYMIYQIFDSIATTGDEIKCKILTTGIKKMLKNTFPTRTERLEFLTNFLKGYSITGDKEKDYKIYIKYIGN